MFLRALKRSGAVAFLQRGLSSQPSGGMCGKSACMQGGCQGMMAQQSKSTASVAAKAGYSDAYAEGWDRIFGKKDDASSSAKVDSEAVATSGAGSSK